MEIRGNSHAAVIGAGTMGCGIAQVASAAGHNVIVIDSNRDALDRGRATLSRSLAAMVKRGRIDEASAAAIEARVDWSPSLADAAGSALAIEAIVERLDAKRALISALAGMMGDEAILASNTSSLSIAAIAAGQPVPERIVGLHFFNPVPAMKLVEVVAGPQTSADVVAASLDLMRRWGKHAVTVRDVPGFIVNRVARPYYAEAFLALEEGLAPALIDGALSLAGGFRMGPLTLADLIGHDINYAAASSVHHGMAPHVRFRPQAAQARLVDAQWLGRKSGRGVYDYAVPPPPLPLIRGEPAASIAISPEAGGLAALASIAAATVDPALPAGIMRIDGIRAGMGDGRPLADREDVDIIIDHLLDPASAAAICANVRDERAAGAAAALAGSLGKDLLLSPDRPGQIALRTWAQLANGAADAVMDGVADEPSIDEAMLYGANYPMGPLHWARAQGIAQVETILRNIAQATGDDIYLPSRGFAAL